MSSDRPTSLARLLDRVVRLGWNHTERRLRLPFRLVLALVVAVLVSRVVSVGIGLLTDNYRGGVLAGAFPGADLGTVLRVVSSLSAALGIAVIVAVAGVALDRRRLPDFGFHVDRSWWADCAFGTALGVALMAGIFLVGYAAGWFRVVGTAFAEPGFSFLGLVAGYLVVFAAVSLTEELMVRGYLLTNLAEGLRVGPVTGRVALGLAVLCTSGLFGWLHAGNPNATLVSTATIALAGIFLAAGYALTGELAVPLGLHFSWNYAQGVLFGFPVSGLRVGVALVRTRETGPDLVTGGRFGPEAGLLGVVAILLGIAAIAGWVRLRSGDLGLAEAVWTPELRWRER
ncbi:CPBP family intramembrane glutamic endopeptidase [Haloglomus litoreum]|uniref:CPBP family intramembrane glutamic endopeptidase n=1 Tax=Haloglomus litoreum TaxID=3034026 RepID=UPI0023E8F2AF|nr:CPBP family intramembrane glutamic endopeptidase [Haloglomus sp. DT116]